MIKVSCLGSCYYETNEYQLFSAVSSLFQGESKPFEIVLVADGPLPPQLNKSLLALIRIFYVKLVRLDTNQGLGPALNEGLQYCNGDIICRFDTDDISSFTRIATLQHVFEKNPHLDIVGSYVTEFTECSGKCTSALLKRTPLSNRSISFMMNFINPVNHPSVAFRRSVISLMGPYQSVPFFEDYYLWLVARKRGLVFRNIPVPLVYMRRNHTLQRRSGFGYMRMEVQFYIRCFREHLLPLSVFPIALARLILRLIPLPLQGFQDYLPWRRRMAYGQDELSLYLLTEAQSCIFQ